VGGLSPRKFRSSRLPFLCLSSFISSQSLVFDDIKMSHPSDRMPVLLLKTRSTPVDTYDEYFSNEPFAPAFVPVLEHRPNIENLEFVQSLLLDGKLGREHNAKYGGIIFTSQRAVEGFAKAVDQAEADSSRLRSQVKSTYSLFPIHRSILHRVTMQLADLFGQALMHMTWETMQPTARPPRHCHSTSSARPPIVPSLLCF
jgi:hypothetical protein